MHERRALCFPPRKRGRARPHGRAPEEEAGDSRPSPRGRRASRQHQAVDVSGSLSNARPRQCARRVQPDGARLQFAPRPQHPWRRGDDHRRRGLRRCGSSAREGALSGRIRRPMGRKRPKFLPARSLRHSMPKSWSFRTVCITSAWPGGVADFNRLSYAKDTCENSVLSPHSGMAIIGYARVSTDGQTLDSQIAALKAAGAARIYRETASGAKAERRELGRALKSITAGDTLLVTRLDRLARSTRDLLNILDTVAKAGAGDRKS